MFSGFQMPAAYYVTFARDLASWGYAALRYDLPSIVGPVRRIVPDGDEVRRGTRMWCLPPPPPAHSVPASLHSLPRASDTKARYMQPEGDLKPGNYTSPPLPR
jgi:hypothetical protein